MPAVFGGLPDVQVYVTGDAAYTLDVVGFYEAGMPQVFLFVLGLSFLLLLVAFHSVVIPIKAILLNLLSTGAAYGLMVLVFQDGNGASIIDVKPGVIEAFIPVFIFTILFGLSMDYHVFILTRIKEARDHGLSSNAAVERGISITAGTVTSAAVIMVAVFAVFVTLRLSIIKQLGFGLAVAVLLDATIIRSVLLPASMRLLGDWNWWMPGFLGWIPRITIEAETEDEDSEAAQEGRRRERTRRSRRSPSASRPAHEPRSRDRPDAAADAALDDLPDHVRRNRAMWDEWATEYVANGERSWRLARRRGDVGDLGHPRGGRPPPARRPRGPRHDRARVRDRPTCRPGWRDAAPGRSASTTPPSSWRRRAGSRPSTGSTSRSITATPRPCRIPTQASISRSPSTAPASGPTHTAGSRRRPGCSGPAAGCSSWSTADPGPRGCRMPTTSRPTSGCSVRTSGSTASNGRATTR